jgi:gluconolactonase
MFRFLLFLLPLAAADFEIKDEAEFKKLFVPAARVERLATGMQFVEGPVWMPEGYLVFSDIPANELKRWDAKGGVTTFRKPSNNANGNTLDRGGQLLTAEHGAHRISRTRADGAVETLVDKFEGRNLNSPNDVVVKSDGSIWFTDPDYGLGGRTKEQAGNYVYRLDPVSKQLTPVIKDFDKPNGLCFSPDESKLYVADSGRRGIYGCSRWRGMGRSAGGRCLRRSTRAGRTGYGATKGGGCGRAPETVRRYLHRTGG